MASSPTAAHECILNAVIDSTYSILCTIPVPPTILSCRQLAKDYHQGRLICRIPNLAIKMWSGAGEGGHVLQQIWLMESAFSQSDRDVMDKLQAFIQDLPNLLVIGKIIVKQET